MMKKHHWTSYFTYALAIALVMLLGWLLVRTNVSKLAAREMPGAVVASAQVREVADPDAPIGVVREYRLDLSGLTERDCCLAFYTVHQYVEVYIGGELVAQWKPLPDSFIKTVGSNWTFVPLYREDGGKEILVRLMPVYEAVREREVTFWVGSELAVYAQRLWLDLPQLIFSCIAILVGLVFLSISGYLLWKRRGGGQLACLGAFALILGLWRINDTRFSPFLLPEKPLLMYYTALGALMIGVIPLLLSLRKQLPSRWQKVLDIYCAGASLLGLCFLAAQVFGGIDLREVLPAIHGVLALGAVGLLVMLFRLKGRESSLPILGALLAVGILADMLCYYCQGNSSGLLYSLLALLICVVYTGWDLVLTVLRREKELADRRLTSMMSQIRPHFIYNTLGSIEQLCELRPEKAAELVHDFALYLRGNFRELDNPAPIRLSQEIKHTQHYVNIEKVRFPDITVEFQMESPDFLLPALSIQPLVENAIKHGLMPLPKGGKVLVRSDVQDESYCIIVEDNGVGFDSGTPTDGLPAKHLRAAGSHVRRQAGRGQRPGKGLSGHPDDPKGGKEMNAIAVDDEPLMLYGLSKAVRASKDITSLGEFTACEEALAYAASHSIDVAFLDVRMRGMDGLTLAEKILECQPDCNIIFCTGYDDYAVEAFRIHASGYLMNPVSTQDVQRELDHILGTDKHLLKIKCFGNFEVYAARGGKPLHFRRSKTMELLAYLVDRRGSGVTGRQISVCLWGEEVSSERSQNYLRQLFLDLRKTLEAVGAEAVLDQQGYRYLLRPEKLDCDYYSYLKNGTPPFLGEYMSQYSWAEETCALLTEKERKR